MTDRSPDRTIDCALDIRGLTVSYHASVVVFSVEAVWLSMVLSMVLSPMSDRLGAFKRYS